MNTEEYSLNFERCEAIERSPRTILEWIDFFQKNKPQINSLSVGIMLLIYGGQNLAWGIFNNHLRVQPWAGGYEDDGVIFWTIFSWFIANICGCIIASFTINRFNKLQIYIITSILCSCSAICFIVNPTSILSINIGRIIGGVSNGIVYLTTMIHACEISNPKIRGYNMSMVNLSVMIGVLITSCYLSEVYKTRSYEMDPTKLLGYNGLICIITGLLLGIFFSRESPVYLIKKYKEMKAFESLIRLRSESHETSSLRQEFNELLLMVKEDSIAKNSKLIYLHPFIVAIYLKTCYISSFNMIINSYLLDLNKLNFYDGMTDKTGICLISARIISMLISAFFIDFKRIKMFVFSSVSSGTLLVYLSIFTVRDDSINSTIIAIMLQIFIGVSINCIGDVYAVDSVNIRFKPYFICATAIYENLLHMILVIAYFYSKIVISKLLACFGVLMVIGVIAIPSKLNFLPDTSGLTLRQASNIFCL